MVIAETPDIEPTTTPDGVRVAVHAFGGDGPAVVLVHAAGLHGRVWQPLARRLLPDFRCLAPDLRGHGDSGRPPGGDFDWRGFAADVLAVVDGLGLGRPFGVGHSSGATALLLAEQARPGTFAALYCYEPVVVPADPPLGPDPDSWLAEVARRRRARFASRPEALGHYAARPPLSALAPDVLAAYVTHGFAETADGGVVLKCRPEDEAAVYVMATAHDCFANLPNVACPVTVAYGGRSQATAPRHVGQLTALLPRGEVAEHPELDHLGPLEDPASVASSIRRTFARSGTARRQSDPAGPASA